MRVLVLSLILAVLSAGPAGARQAAQAPPQFQGGRIVVAEPGAKDEAAKTSVLTAQGAARIAEARQAAAAPLPPTLALLARPIESDGGQCRLGCARSYYFCMASDSADECPSSWGQCRARCAKTPF